MLLELPGSARRYVDAPRPRARVHPDKSFTVSLHLSRRSGDRPPPFESTQQLSRAAFARAHGAHPRHADRLRRFCDRHELTLHSYERASRTAVVRGPARSLEAAFGVELVHYEHRGERYQGHESPVHLPAELENVVLGVFGLHTGRAARPHLRHFAAKKTKTPPDIEHYTADQVGRLYQFPPELDGSGECIGLLELGGGFRREDLRAFFRRVGLKMPKISTRSVNGHGNRPLGRPMSDDSEVLLDTEVAGAVAPGAHLVLYFSSSDERGFIDGVKAAVHDSEHAPSVISISWGNPEAEWSRSAVDAMNEVFQDAAALGITVCASAGDEGASAGLAEGLAVEFPASSPYVLSCGGTRLIAGDGGIRRESVWNDLRDGFGATGGGVSSMLARPRYQGNAGVPRSPNKFRGRGVPDVAGNADPETGYLTRVDGHWIRLGGTSAVSPLWAGLAARINEGLRKLGNSNERLGFVTPRLYRRASSQGLRSITSGDNGGYSAGPDWDACTGLGSPNGVSLLDALTREALSLPRKRRKK